MLALEEKSGDDLSINPLRMMNVCTTFHSNSSNSCWQCCYKLTFKSSFFQFQLYLLHFKDLNLNLTAQSGFPFSSLQGLMFGYATDETEECMPLTILLAHKLNNRMKELSRNGECLWILPDSKSQVSHLSRKTLIFNCKTFPQSLSLPISCLIKA